MPTKILIVEDEAITAVYLKDFLVDEGYEVIGLASKGEDAIDISKNNHVDIILMDIQLAGKIDGIETAEKILSNSHVPIIFMTGFNSQLVYKRLEKIDTAGFLKKPLDLMSMLSLIEQNS